MGFTMEDMEEDYFEDFDDDCCGRACDCYAFGPAGLPEAETYSTSALMISSAQSMAAMFSLMVSNMARLENAANFGYPVGPGSPILYANNPTGKSVKVKTNNVTKDIADLEFANELSGAPVVK